MSFDWGIKKKKRIKSASHHTELTVSKGTEFSWDSRGMNVNWEENAENLTIKLVAHQSGISKDLLPTQFWHTKLKLSLV